jgi:phage virion morphogenesis protein
METGVTVVSDTLTPALKRLRNNVANPAPVMRTIANVLDRSTKANFKAQGRPAKWEALQPSTIHAKVTKTKRRGSGHILRGATSTLIKSIQTRSTRYQAEIGAPGVVPATHQVGTTRAGRRHNIRIPQRSFIGRSDNPSPKTQLLLLREDEDAIVKAVDEHIMGGQT